MTITQMLSVLRDFVPLAEAINKAIGPGVIGDPGNRQEPMWLAHVHSAAVIRSIQDTIKYLEKANGH